MFWLPLKNALFVFFLWIIIGTYENTFYEVTLQNSLKRHVSKINSIEFYKNIIALLCKVIILLSFQ